MISADQFIQAAKQRGFGLYSGVPCSYLTPFINYVIDSNDLRYVGAANEGDAVAIAAGAALAGQRAVAMFQNSGMGNAVNPLTSLTWTFKLPILVITTLRGEPGGPADEPQHELMGAITTQMLESMRIPWEYFPRESEQIAAALDRAVAHMDAQRTPYALVMQKDAVDKWPLRSKPQPRATFSAAPAKWDAPAATRADMLTAIQQQARPDDVLIATTGFTGRELYALDDRASQLYMVGSMGCASSFGLGVALAQPQRRVIVIDGDGAALMRMGAFTTIGYERPPNLIHILLDNEAHESTGSQSTVAHSVDFCAIAAACGYPRTARTTSVDGLADALASAGNELRFVHVKIMPGTRKDLPRPKVTPAQVAERLRRFLSAGEA
jgi:phosphonopyruvate decarboxylase